MIRPEGVSGVAFGSRSDGDPRVDAAARADLSRQLGIPSEWAWVRQVHGSEVAVAIAPGIGREADAVVTTDPSLPVAVSVADCLPVAILAAGAVGMAHAGWRGAAAGVVEMTIAEIRAQGFEPHTAVIGPGIGPCCFEVGSDVAAVFPERRSTTTWGTGSVDLPAAVAGALDGLRVVSAWECTYHDDRFHSFRDTGTAERQFGVAWIAPD